ncbi:hypothetical protein EST38_g3688 [Candolleomyces aberdarensis]|uniref:H-type lectin domain-containing protein n=1 Tax=Candolleomyces aberdarensis TaxID=2316362 RepID=A0A4Q2DPB9_9AGAR|nr:hypothetical protein EST38_g3688 [Candolleomyces aberdarensis]
MDSQDTPGIWIQVYGGDLVPVILQLLKSPKLGLIEGGKDGDDPRPLYVARYVSSNGCSTICYQRLVRETKGFEVLVHANSDVHGAKVLLGSYRVDNDWRHTKQAARYYTAVKFAQPLINVPRVAVGLRMLDHHNAWVYMQCMDEPTWQTGVFNFKASSFKKWGSEERVTFDKPFSDGPPILFACLSGIEAAGNRSVRIYTTNVDQSGFTVGVTNSSEEGGSSGDLIATAATWIAIPGSEFMKKKNVWMGTFTTDMGSSFNLDKHGPGGWRGHVEFGFEFRRAPKIFIGLRQFCTTNDGNLCLQASTSNVTTSGMDWALEKWSLTRLLSAGANFFAFDADS